MISNKHASVQSLPTLRNFLLVLVLGCPLVLQLGCVITCDGSTSLPEGEERGRYRTLLNSNNHIFINTASISVCFKQYLIFTPLQHYSNTKVHAGHSSHQFLVYIFWVECWIVEYLKYGDKTIQMIGIKLTCSMFQVYHSVKLKTLYLRQERRTRVITGSGSRTTVSTKFRGKFIMITASSTSHNFTLLCGQT